MTIEQPQQAKQTQEDMLTQLLGMVAQNNKMMTEMQGNIKGMQGTIVAMQGSIMELNRKFDSVQSEVVTLKEDITDIRNTMATKDDLSQLRNTMATQDDLIAIKRSMEHEATLSRLVNSNAKSTLELFQMESRNQFNRVFDHLDRLTSHLEDVGEELATTLETPAPPPHTTPSTTLHVHVSLHD